MADHYTAVVIGAGISGLVALKTLRQKNVNCVLLEANDYHGGLWHYSAENYGVMAFTHINVSKYNYAFSDFPFPDDACEYPHHLQMARYIDSYVEKFGLAEHIRYNTRVLQTQRSQANDKVKWTIQCRDTRQNLSSEITCDHLAIASGHHAKPKHPNFPGQEKFTGKMIHSVSFKDVFDSGFEEKNVVVVGIGNSAVDTAVNCAARGRCRVNLSTRSGAWVVPNYVFSYPTDLYASRFFLSMIPFPVQQFIMEAIISLLSGHPSRWKLNPKMGALQTQPTVSPTLIHHIQRGDVMVSPNIKEIGDRWVRFSDNSVAEDVDAIINCTGYSIDIPYLPEEIKQLVLDPETNDLRLYKSVFSPDVGPCLSFIGFVQPASGGIISMSEVQSQWLTMIITDKCQLPAYNDMLESISKTKEESRSRYYKSERHTIQQDPILYNDDVAQLFGARPCLSHHPALFHRLLFGSGGVAQWTLEGPFSNSEAHRLVKKVPVPPFSLVMMGLILFILIYLLHIVVSSFIAIF